MDLSKLRHEDKCCYWDAEEFCDCGAIEYELLLQARKTISEIKHVISSVKHEEDCAVNWGARPCNCWKEEVREIFEKRDKETDK